MRSKKNARKTKRIRGGAANMENRTTKSPSDVIREYKEALFERQMAELSLRNPSDISIYNDKVRKLYRTLIIILNKNPDDASVKQYIEETRVKKEKRDRENDVISPPIGPPVGQSKREKYAEKKNWKAYAAENRDILKTNGREDNKPLKSENLKGEEKAKLGQYFTLPN